jgi:type I restriction enzyme R subunit
LTPEDTDAIQQVIPADQLQAFRGVYLETARVLKEQQDKAVDDPQVQQLDFEFVLFASAVIDYDYIMGLIARYTEGRPEAQRLSRDQLIALIASDAKFMNEQEDIGAYIDTLQVGRGLSEVEIRQGYETFKAQRNAQQLAEIASRYALEDSALQAFVDGILRRLVFDGEQLRDLLVPLDLGWRARTKTELALMKDLIPILKKRAEGREISGLHVYEQQ